MKNRGVIAAATISVVLMMTLLCSCGTRRNTAMSRQWQAFTTRYNVYFNGKEHFDETLKSMNANYQDDYSRFIPVDPAEARGDATLPQPEGDFTRTIEKMQKAIQLHSITKKPRPRTGSVEEKKFRSRTEFNPFLHHAWLMMAKSQYYNGDFLGATTTFTYIARHFPWLPTTVTDARLWAALCYCALGWRYEAESTLRLVKEKDLSDRELATLYYKAHAEICLLVKDYNGAAEFLEKALPGTKGYPKKRLWFLLGQLYANVGEKAKAYEAFREAGRGEAVPYRAKFNARIRRSEVYPGADVKGEIKSLSALTRYARNTEFLDQIYYALGNLSLASGDTALAMRNYRLAVEKSTRQGLDKALAQIALGNLYFKRGEYEKAQPCYAEALPLLPESYPDLETIRKRSDVLDRLALYSGNVHLQDSLLELASLTPEERTIRCERIAREYQAEQKRLAEEQRRGEFKNLEEARGNDMPSGSVPNFIPNADKSWYFYNPQTVAAGKTEFQRRWGARKLEDNWRRRNKAEFAVGIDEGPADGVNDLSGEDDANRISGSEKSDAMGPETAAYYLAQIPDTPEEIATANDIVQEGLYNMGLILKDRLEDYPAARREFMRLDRRYPDNVYRQDVYYNMYIMAVITGDMAEAERWRRMMVEDFPDTPLGAAMRDPDYFENLKRMKREEETLYENAYEAYLDGCNAEVHRLADDVEKRYPLSRLLPKFVFLDALTYLSEGEDAPYRERLSTLLERWPDTEMTPVAVGIMKGLKAGRRPHAGGRPARGMIWEIRLHNDSVERETPLEKATFERDPDSPQYLVLVFPRDSVNANQLLYDVARFNFSTFVIKDFDLEPMSFGEVGLLLIKGFENLRELEYYRRRMADDGFELPSGVRPVMISKHNFELLLREGRSFEEYFRFEENPPAPGGLPEPEPPGEEHED